MSEVDGDQRLLAAADDLYALGVGEFTAARDALSASLKGEDKKLAAQVKGLRKPTTAAWVVNLFVRREPEQVEQLLALGAALRDAQTSLDGVELRALSRQRRQVTAAMAASARSLAADEGQRLTQSVTDQVEGTFTAALLNEDAATALRSGMLVTAITVSGVDPVDLTAAVALSEAWGFTAPARETPPPEEEPARPVLRLVPDPERRTRERRAAKEALVAADRALARAQRAQRAAHRRVDDLQARVLRVRSELEELRRRLAEAETEAEEVEDELAEAEEERDEADSTLLEAEEERDDAAATLASHD